MDFLFTCFFVIILPFLFNFFFHLILNFTCQVLADIYSLQWQPMWHLGQQLICFVNKRPYDKSIISFFVVVWDFGKILWKNIYFNCSVCSIFPICPLKSLWILILCNTVLKVHLHFLRFSTKRFISKCSLQYNF